MCLVVALNFLVASAHISNAIIISPAIIDLNLERGQTYEGEFSIFFREDDPEQFFLYLRKLEFEDQTNKQITVTALPNEPTLSNWITLEKTIVDKPATIGIVNEDSIVKIKYTVAIPANAPPGAHFAQIIVSQTAPEDFVRGAQVSLGAEVGYQILVNLKGDRDYNTTLVSFKTKDDQTFFPFLPVEFITSFKNEGNVYVIPNANIEIFQFGSKVDNITLNENQNRVFPGLGYTFNNIWSEDDQKKLPTNFLESVTYEIQNFRIGFYTAEIQGFAGAQAPFKSSLTFFVIPYHLFAVIIAIIIVYITYKKLAKQQRKQRRKS